MQRKASSLERKVKEVYDYQIDPDEVEKKLTDLENCSRRKNLRIDGVAEENGEGWDDYERKMKEIFMDKLELENDINIERAHRARKGKYGKKDQPRTIVCKVLSHKDKNKVLPRKFYTRRNNNKVNSIETECIVIADLLPLSDLEKCMCNTLFQLMIIKFYCHYLIYKYKFTFSFFYMTHKLANDKKIILILREIFTFRPFLTFHFKSPHSQSWKIGTS